MYDLTVKRLNRVHVSENSCPERQKRTLLGKSLLPRKAVGGDSPASQTRPNEALGERPAGQALSREACGVMTERGPTESLLLRIGTLARGRFTAIIPPVREEKQHQLRPCLCFCFN